MLGVPLKSICEMIPPSCPLEKNRAVTSLRCIGACCMCSTTLISSPGLYFCKGCSLTQSSFRTPASTTVSVRAPETLPKPAGAPCPPRRRCYWLGRCLSSLRSISSSHILVSRSRRYLANSWETSRRAIRPCTASSVLCGLAVSISRACCSSAIRWLSSMMPPCVQFLDAFRLTLPKIHKQHTAGEGMTKSRGPRGRNPATTGFGNVSVLAILLDPVALIVLLVPILHGAPGHPVGAVLFSVLILCGVEGLLVDLLSVLGEVVLDIIR